MKTLQEKQGRERRSVLKMIYYDPKEVGRRIGEVRRNAGLKQWELAMELHITRDMLARIETGKNTCGPDYLMYLCQRFDKTADYFYFGTKKKDDIDKTRIETINEIRQLLGEISKEKLIMVLRIIKIVVLYDDE